MKHSRSALIVSLIVACTTSSSWAQKSGFDSWTAGSGEVSPSVVATWEAHNAPISSPTANQPVGPLLLDLLVLWRGSPGWFVDGGMEAGGSSHLHKLSSRGRVLELRFDPERRRVQIGGKAITLEAANVLLLDNVDRPGEITVSTATVDPAFPREFGRAGAAMDPLGSMLQRSPELLAFLRCQPSSSDRSDSAALHQLGYCQTLLRR
jgi:hypothetical protein